MSDAIIGDEILATAHQAVRALTPTSNSESPLRHAFAEAYETALTSEAAAIAAERADCLFATALMIETIDDARLRRFVRSWNETHVSSDLVGVLALRLSRAGHADAAGQMLEVIADDIGERSLPHREMFARFADTLCAPYSWRDGCYAEPAAKNFRRYLTQARQQQPLDVGILTTAASEIWNVGEYTTLSPRMDQWMQSGLGLSAQKAGVANAYVRVHAGETELNHFLHAITAYEMLCARTGQEPSPTLAGTIMTTYLHELAKAYDGLYQAIKPHNQYERAFAPHRPRHRAPYFHSPQQDNSELGIG